MIVFKKVLRNKTKIILLKIIFSCITKNKKFEKIIINKKYNKTGADLSGRIELKVKSIEKKIMKIIRTAYFFKFFL